MIKFLQDSYNGIYKILLKPYIPSTKTLALLVGGFLLGLIVAYALFPTVYYDADPSTLHQSWQDEWVKMLADRNAVANADVSGLIIDLLSRIDNPSETVARLTASASTPEEQQRLAAIQPYADSAQANAASAPQPNTVQSLIPWIAGPILLVILGSIVAIVYGMFIYPNLVEPLIKRMRGEKVSEQVAAMRAQVAAQKAAETQKTDFTTSNLGPPIFQKMSSYTLGMGSYDFSYSIEDTSGRFLGECGVSASESIGVGEPERTTAAEVWLFDKDDFQQTITKVLVSPHAMNDPALRSRLEPRGDLVVAQPGATVTLETATLRMTARVVELEYGTGPLPPNSYFQRITVELAAWRKDAGTPISATPAPVIAAQPVQASYTPLPPQNPPQMPPTNPPQYSQPPSMPPASSPSIPSAPQSRPPMPPASTPPARPRVDDDPFGGTGDFTPVN